VAIDAMELLRPIAVGDEVSCYCALAHRGETSHKVRIETWARGRGGAGASAEKVTGGVFTFVAIGESGQLRPLPSSQADSARR
jgi:acyl-CoA thioesterase YciA